MTRKAEQLDDLLDRALDEIREDAMSPEAERTASERVLDIIRREAEKHTLDEASQADEAAAASGNVRSIDSARQEAKRWLSLDAQEETLQRGRAVRQAAATRSVATPSSGVPAWVSRWGLRAAAAIVIVVAVYGFSVKTDVLTITTQGLVDIESITGTEAQKRNEDGTTEAVQTGQAVNLRPGEALITGKSTQLMFRTPDGSRVEVAPRSEVGLTQARLLWKSRPDSVIQLDRGNMIVEASKQGSGHLYVNTPNADIAVTGTVFAVNAGMKGSRVSVIEGQVEVDQRDRHDVLTPGQQVTTSANLGHVSVADEISWSANAAQHLALLRAMTELGQELDQVLVQDLRYSTDLLELTPANTTVYIGAPNLVRSADEAYDVLERKIASSAELKDWWDREIASTDTEETIEKVMSKLGAFGAQFGDEIALAILANPAAGPGHDADFIGLAQLTAPASFREFVEAEIAEAAANLEGDQHDLNRAIVILEGSDAVFPAEDGEEHLYLWIRDGFLIAGNRVSSLMATAGQVGASGATFEPGSFRARLADQYREGAEWVVGVDLQSLMPDHAGDSEAATQMGLMDMQHLIANQKTREGFTESRVTLGFNQARRGVAGWLDAPAPIGAMDYISAEAILAGGFVMKEPAILVEELLQVIEGTDSDFRSRLSAFESEHGIDVRRDIAAPLGGEFAFALEYPIVPKPNWKLVMQVYDEAALQRTIEWAVGESNRAADEHVQGDLLELNSDSSGGKVFYEIRNPATGISAHYLYTDGYLIAGSSRVQLNNALQTARQGFSLNRSAQFLGLLPADSENNFSGVLYQNLGGALDAFAGIAQRFVGEDSEFAQSMSMSGPSLTVAYGGAQDVTFVYRREGGIFGGTIGSFFNLTTLMSMDSWTGAGVQSRKRAPISGDDNWVVAQNLGDSDGD